MGALIGVGGGYWACLLAAELFQGRGFRVAQELALVIDLIALDGDHADLGLGVPEHGIGRNMEAVLDQDFDGDDDGFRRFDLIAAAEIGRCHGALPCASTPRLIFDAGSLLVLDQLIAIAARSRRHRRLLEMHPAK